MLDQDRPQESSTALVPAPPRRAARVGRTLGWLLACLGVLAVDMLVSFAASMGLYASMGLIDAGLLPPIDDGTLMDIAQLTMQALSFTVAIVWFSCLRGRRGSGRSFARRREAACPLRFSAGDVAARVALVLAAGLALQVFIGYASDAVLSFFPQVAEDYNDLMESTGLNDIALLPIVATVVGAPLCEELMIRGVLFEFALRAFNADGAAAPGMRSRGFWLANITQAAAFGLMHMNLVQGCYAFVAGLALGWVFYRTGRIRYSMLLHLAFNFGSYFLEMVWVSGSWPMTIAIITVSGCALLALLRALDRKLDAEAASLPSGARRP